MERKCENKENDNTEHTQAMFAECMVAPAIVYTGHERVILDLSVVIKVNTIVVIGNSRLF